MLQSIRQPLQLVMAISCWGKKVNFDMEICNSTSQYYVPESQEIEQDGYNLLSGMNLWLQLFLPWHNDILQFEGSPETKIKESKAFWTMILNFNLLHESSWSSEIKWNQLCQTFPYSAHLYWRLNKVIMKGPRWTLTNKCTIIFSDLYTLS